MATRTWTMRRRPREGTRGFVVAFARTRTRFVDLTVNLDGVRPKLVPEHKLAIARWAARDVRGEGEVELTVEYQGDTPLIARFVWIGSKGGLRDTRLLPRRRPGPPDSSDIDLGDPEGVPAEFLPLWHQERARVGITPGVVATADVSALVSSLEIGPEEVFRRRREFIEADSRVQAYFEDLDRASHPDLGAADLLAAVERVSYMLKSRLESRAWHGTARDASPPQCPEFEAAAASGGGLGTLEYLQRISAFMRELIEAHLLPSAAAGFAERYPQTAEQDLTGWAYEQFASDSGCAFHLAPAVQDLLQSHGAPNSSEFFKFAELAFACVDSDVDREFWEQRLEVFTRVSQIVVENSRVPPTGDGRLGESASYGFEPGRYFPSERRLALQEDYARLIDGSSPEQRLVQLQDRFTSILGQALPDTLSSPHRGPLRELVHAATIERVREG